MNIINIYKNYNIPPNLQTHMLRVASVAKLISDNINQEVNKDEITTACLLHDMGNIIKFDFDKFPEFTKPKGRKYWESVQKKFIEEYGDNEHLATEKIIKAITNSPKIVELVNSIGFTKIESNKPHNLESLVCKYSDLRVAPNGITSLNERLNEAKSRYVFSSKPKWTENEFNHYANLWKQAEPQIFQACKITPKDITDDKISKFIKSLRKYDIC